MYALLPATERRRVCRKKRKEREGQGETMEERDRKEEAGVEGPRPPPSFPKVCVLGSWESRSQSVIVCPLEEGEKEEEGRLPQMRILSEGRGTFFEVWCREES